MFDCVFCFVTSPECLVFVLIAAVSACLVDLGVGRVGVTRSGFVGRFGKGLDERRGGGCGDRVGRGG